MKDDNWQSVVERDRLYRPKELGGKSKPEKGILGISYDSVIRQIVDNPRYADSVVATWNAKRTHRSHILIPGWVVLRWLADHSLGKAA